MSLDTILLLGALVCFIAVAIGINARVNLVAVGLALYIVSLLL